jgi:hypothetical protein
MQAAASLRMCGLGGSTRVSAASRRLSSSASLRVLPLGWDCIDCSGSTKGAMTAGEPSMPCRLTAANCVAFVSCPSISDFTRRSGRDGKLAVQGAVRVQGSEMPSSVLKSNAHDEAAMWRPNAGELKNNNNLLQLPTADSGSTTPVQPRTASRLQEEAPARRQGWRGQKGGPSIH